MIPCAFDYYRPESLEELAQAVAQAPRPFLFLSGGTEIVTLAQAGEIAPKAVVALKHIPACTRLALEDGCLYIGAAVTLHALAKSGLFPLAGSVGGRISDHTNQCAITVGGNICGTIRYREAALPFLLADAWAGLWEQGKITEKRLCECFKGRLARSQETALIYLRVEAAYLSMPYAHVKKVKSEKIDYPLLTMAVVKAPEGIRMALSGMCGFPFLVECAALAKSGLSPEEKAEAVAASLPAPALTDRVGSAAWRAFVLKGTAADIIRGLEEK